MTPIHRIAAWLGLLAVAAWPRPSGASPDDKGQTPMSRPGPQGFSGPVAAHLKAGDYAPALQFTKVLHSPANAQWNPANAFTETTVLVFLPLISGNPQQMDQWNALQERFAGRPVHFVLITQEIESSLVPWLARHPVNGWLLYDPTAATGRAYGLRAPGIVYVGFDRKIVAFSQGIVPQDKELNEIIEVGSRTRPSKP